MLSSNSKYEFMMEAAHSKCVNVPKIKIYHHHLLTLMLDWREKLSLNNDIILGIYRNKFGVFGNI